MIDIVRLRTWAKLELIKFYVKDNQIMCTDIQTGETVCVGTVEVQKWY